ncbi:MAG TPA: hypothetical protein VD864_06400 [Nocardioides sp.]|nr:hypothetical protein [Nocardioides sp.]
MCRRVTCRRCGKASWSGCGAHVAQVMAGVPTSERCQGHDGEPRASLMDRLRGKA